MMASSFTYSQFQPQPPPIPRMTGGKRGPSGPLIVSSSSEDEDSDTSESLPPPGPAIGQHLLAPHKAVTPHTDLPKSPRSVQILELPATPRIKTGGGKFPPAPLSSPRKETSVPTLMTCNVAPSVPPPAPGRNGAGESDDDDDEDDDDHAPSSPSAPESPRVSSAASPPPASNFAHEHDHDYENVASPCSSTASGPIYVRPPGFTYHAQEVESVKSKIVRKKSRPAAVISLREDGFGSASKREQTPPKAKPRRDPLPMRLRALPQSFWQQPNVTQQVSPATMFPVLPPLCHKDTEEDMAEVRPVTPPLSDLQDPTPTADCDPERVDRVGGQQGKHPVGERKITVANTDLLFKLFENVGRDDKKTTTVHMKRGRPKRSVAKTAMKGLLSGNDPYLVDASSVADSLFPQLSLESSRATGTGHTSLQLVTIGSGDKTVTLPSLSVEQNYPQMLSELVMHI